MDPLKLDQAELQTKLSRLVETGMEVVATYGLKVLGAIIILIVGWIAAGIVSRSILREFGRFSRIDQTIITFTASTAKYAVLTFTLIAVLSSVGVQTTSFVAVMGALGLAIGLALQGTLNHVASGLLLVIFRPFKVGVAHQNDIEKVMALMRSIINTDARVAKQPPPAVNIARLTDAAVVLAIQVWVKTADVPEIRPSLNRAIKDIFTAQGVIFPAPSPPRV